MKMRVSCGWVGAVLLATPIAVLSAQSGTLPKVIGTGSATSTMRFTMHAGSTDAASDQILRTIDDPGTGRRWLLLRDESHPGGPARLVLSTQDALSGAESKDSVNSASLTSTSPTAFTAASTSAPIAKTGIMVNSPRPELASPPPPALIRAGDHVSLERHSTVVDVQLEAVALQPAAMGSTFNARLVIGGRIVRAIAVAQGHATFAPGIEGQP